MPATTWVVPRTPNTWRSHVMAESLRKHPSHVRDYKFDFAAEPEITGGQTLTGTPTVTATPSGLTFNTPTISGSIVTVQITGGTDGDTHRLTCSVTTSGSKTLVGRGDLVVSTEPEST